jgi:hypothetical protein
MDGFMREQTFALRRQCAQRSAAATWAAVCILISMAARADDEELIQHSAHEHGKVTINAVVGEDTLVLELEAPADNVLGFEHAPRDEAERQAATRAAELLNSGRNLFGVPRSADCRLDKAEVTEPDWQKSHGHADYEARFIYRCAKPANLQWFEPWLLKSLSSVSEARINLITPAGQRSEQVSSPQARVSLR